MVGSLERAVCCDSSNHLFYLSISLYLLIIIIRFTLKEVYKIPLNTQLKDHFLVTLLALLNLEKHALTTQCILYPGKRFTTRTEAMDRYDKVKPRGGKEREREKKEGNDFLPLTLLSYNHGILDFSGC